jgi:hypothetical protein
MYWCLVWMYANLYFRGGEVVVGGSFPDGEVRFSGFGMSSC